MTSFVIHIYLFLVYLLLYNEAKSYHAVVIIHGVLTGSESMELVSNRIQEVGGMALMTAEQKDLHIFFAISLCFVLLCKCNRLILLLYLYIFLEVILSLLIHNIICSIVLLL